MGMCKTTLIGVVADEPKMFTSQNGYNIATVRVKVDEQKIIKGEARTMTSWHTVKVFGNQAPRAAALAKGSLVLAQGDLRRNKYTKKDGTEAVSWEIAADSIQDLLNTEVEADQAQAETPFSTPKPAGNEYVPF